MENLDNGREDVIGVSVRPTGYYEGEEGIGVVEEVSTTQFDWKRQGLLKVAWDDGTTKWLARRNLAEVSKPSAR